MVVLALAVGALGIQFVRPERSNPPESPDATLQAHFPMSGQAAVVWERSCSDCHSHRTRWPWYSQVAPVSWFVADHVSHARKHLNVSQWSRYQPKAAAEHLEEICEETRERKMPLPSYLWIHRGARMSAQDIEALCAWSSGARASLGPVGGDEGEEGQEGAHREAEPQPVR